MAKMGDAEPHHAQHPAATLSSNPPLLRILAKFENGDRHKQVLLEGGLRAVMYDESMTAVDIVAMCIKSKPSRQG